MHNRGKRMCVEAILPTYLYRFRKGGQFADQVIPAT